MMNGADVGPDEMLDAGGGQGGASGGGQGLNDSQDSGCGCAASTNQETNPLTLLYVCLILVGFGRRRRTQ